MLSSLLSTNQKKEMIMAQILKESVRELILDAATKLFARLSYKQATMGMIAKEAGIATGNIYKYFPNKDDLFYSIVTPKFVEELRSLTSDRVYALNQPERLSELDSITDQEAGKLLQFWIENRLKVIILLSGSQGSDYENFRKEYMQSMFNQSITLIPQLQPHLQDNQLFRFTFKNQLLDTVNGVVSILKEFENGDDIAKAFSSSWAYHHAGIQALIQWHSNGNQ